MTTIPDAIYQELTLQQRIAASVAALARDDNEEAKKLTSTCRKR